MELNDRLFTSDIPVERELIHVLDDGEVIKQTVYVRLISTNDMRRQTLAEASDDNEIVVKALATLLSKHICDARGNAVMDEEKAGRLKPAVSGYLRDLIMEENGLKKRKEKPEEKPEE